MENVSDSENQEHGPKISSYDNHGDSHDNSQQTLQRSGHCSDSRSHKVTNSPNGVSSGKHGKKRKKHKEHKKSKKAKYVTEDSLNKALQSFMQHLSTNVTQIGMPNTQSQSDQNENPYFERNEHETSAEHVSYDFDASKHASCNSSPHHDHMDCVNVLDPDMSQDSLLNQTCKTHDPLSEDTLQPNKTKVESNFSKFFKDAPSFVELNTIQEPIALDSEQIELLKKGWRSTRPETLTSYSGETYKTLRPGTENEELLSVPMLDQFVAFLNNRQGRTTKEGYRDSLWSNLENRLRKIHRASQMGILAIVATQKHLFDCRALLQTCLDNGLNQEQFDSLSKTMLDSFDMSNRALEQFSRAGGLTHQARRFVVLQDISTPQNKQKQWLDLPLTHTGIMGKKFNEKLGSMQEMSEQYKAAANQLSSFNSNSYGRKNTINQYDSRNIQTRSSTSQPRGNQAGHATGFKKPFMKPSTQYAATRSGLGKPTSTKQVTRKDKTSNCSFRTYKQ